MTLSFAISAQVYDATANAIRFLALDGQRLVVCSVPADVLMEAAGLSYPDPRHLLGAFLAHRDRLRALASAKYERLGPPRGAITLGPADLAA